MSLFRAIASGACLAVFTCVGHTATISVAPASGDTGFSDTTPFTPVGGNNATTLGAARMNVIDEAARIWGRLLQSNVTIHITATFSALTCSSTSGTLGSAGATRIYRNFSASVSPNVYYVKALANAIAGTDLNASVADISATFNSSVDSDSACLGGNGFYYGLDHNRGSKYDLLIVMLHELGHGLGFASTVDASTGKGITESDNVERFDIFTANIFDETQNQSWPAMTDAQRVQSATNTGHLAWNGSNVNTQMSLFTRGFTTNNRARLYAPSTLSPGSSVSHFDTVVTPSVLMEPNLSSSIVTSSTDITPCALADIGWTVNACPHYVSTPPTADPQAVATSQNTPIIVTLSGSDPNNNALTYALASNPRFGTLSAISSTNPPTVTYTPNTNYHGQDSFTFTVANVTYTSAPATIGVTVNAVASPPTAADLNITATSGVSTSITLQGTDPNNLALTYSIGSQPSHGTLTGSGPDVTYQSNAGYVGTDSFTYRVSNGTASSAPATVTISVQSAAQVTTSNSSSGGGGGSSDVGFLLLVGALTAGRRRHRRVRP